MVSASDLLIGVETRSFDVVFFVRYQFWFANGTGYQYDGAHCSELSKSVQKVYELKLNYYKKVFFFLVHLFARDVLVINKLENFQAI